MDSVHVLLLFLCSWFEFYVESNLSDFKDVLKCRYYNESDPPNNHHLNSGDLNYEIDSDNLDDEPTIDCNVGFCFAVWANDTKGRITKKMKGCFPKDGSLPMPGQSRCVSKGRSRNMFYCYCDEDLCNSNFYLELDEIEDLAEYDSMLHKERNSGITLSIIILIICLIFLLTVIYIYRRQKICYLNQIPQYERRSITEVTSSTDRLLPIELIEVKAKGRFGDVWKALNRESNELVAVKIQEKRFWLTEQGVFKLPHMNHENILQFIAAEKRYENFTSKYWLITAFLEKGSLCDYLKNNTVTWEELCKISYTMARGLAHLHDEVLSRTNESFKPQIAHRDFKSNNVLLKNDLTACIADFGLAIIFKDSQTNDGNHGQVGTRRYMAPEVLEGSINFSSVSFQRIDIYACGLVLWEILTRCTVHEDASSPYLLPFQRELGEHPTMEDMLELVVQNRQRPELKETWRNHPLLSGVCETIEECWDPETEARLSASCIAHRFYWNLNASSSS